MNDRFNIRYFNKNTRKFEYYKIGTVNINPFTDCTVYKQGQFCTGLKDKNGKLIYEGDIIKTQFGDVMKIVFEIGSFMMVRNVYTREIEDWYAIYTDAWNDDVYPLSQYYFNTYSEDNYIEQIEVIGNIYENDCTDGGKNELATEILDLLDIQEVE